MVTEPDLPPVVIKLTGYVVSVDPKITVIPDFVSASECDYFISLGESIGFSESLVGRGASDAYEYEKSRALSNQVSPNRTSLSVTLPTSHSDEAIHLLEHRLAQITNLPVSHLESLVVVKYMPGQFFRSHHDGSFRPYTVFVYLNDVAEGGETRFEQLQLRVRPRKGTAVVWSNIKISDSGKCVSDDRMVHEALPPVDCVKYGINCFFNEDNVRHLF